MHIFTDRGWKEFCLDPNFVGPINNSYHASISPIYVKGLTEEMGADKRVTAEQYIQAIRWYRQGRLGKDDFLYFMLNNCLVTDFNRLKFRLRPEVHEPPSMGDNHREYASTMKPRTRALLEQTAAYYQEYSDLDIQMWDDNQLREYVRIKTSVTGA